MEWMSCKECAYFEDCETKEDREGCYNGILKDGGIMSLVEPSTECAAKVKHGEWIFEVHSPNTLGMFRCSVCGMTNGIKATDCCPHCGAKMDGGGSNG